MSLPKLGNPQKIRLDLELERKIEALAILNGERKSDLMRRLLNEAADAELAEKTLGSVLPQIRRAVSESMKPAEERLAKLNVKTGISSATGMYILLEYLGQLGKKDTRTVHQEARKRAVAFTRSNPNVTEDELANE